MKEKCEMVRSEKRKGRWKRGQREEDAFFITAADGVRKALSGGHSIVKPEKRRIARPQATRYQDLQWKYCILSGLRISPYVRK